MTAWLPLLLGLASAVEVVVQPATGSLRAEVPTEVQVVALGDDRLPLPGPLEVRASAGTWTRLDDGRTPGVARFAVVAPSDIDEVSVRVMSGAQSGERVVAVLGSSASGLLVRPLSPEGDSRALRFVVEGEGVPRPEALQVVTSEGRVGRVSVEQGALVVEVLPDDLAVARLIVVGVRDVHGEGLPVFATLRLRGRVEVPVESLPGTQVSLDVAGRRYGPEPVPESGKVVLPVDYGPEDTAGRIRLVDPYGNEASYSFPLPGKLAPQLVGLVSGPRYPGEPFPEVVLHGVRADGRPWTREAPTCRSGSTGELPLVRVATGVWRVRLPPTLPDDVWEVRLRCSLGGETETGLAVPLAESVPVALSVRVWPEVLSTDLPVADVQVALINAIGERVEARGTFRARADLGRVEIDRRSGPSMRGEYRGDLAVEIGEDRIQVEFFRGAGAGAVARLEFASGGGLGASAVAFVRALDDQRRPLPEREIEVSLGGNTATVQTGSDGWARVALPLAVETGWGHWVARSEGIVRHEVLLRGAPEARGPGVPDLVTEARIRVDPGRVAEVDLQVLPRVLRPGPRAEAVVRARMLDREGLLANAPMPSLSVSEGAVQPVGKAADGAWEWRYLPPPGFAARTVELTARSDALDVEDRASLSIRSAPVNRWVSVSAGLQTNFGRILSPTVAVDAEWRIRLGAREEEVRLGRSRFMIRVGASWYGAQADEEAVPGVDGRLRMDLLPLSLLLGLRQEYPAHAFWVQLGGVAAPFLGSAAYGGVVVTRRVGILPPGVVLAGGYGVRVAGGEVAFELKGTVLTSPGSDISFEGQVGGLAATLGYRLFY